MNPAKGMTLYVVRDTNYGDIYGIYSSRSSAEIAVRKASEILVGRRFSYRVEETVLDEVYK